MVVSYIVVDITVVVEKSVAPVSPLVVDDSTVVDLNVGSV